MYVKKLKTFNEILNAGYATYATFIQIQKKNTKIDTCPEVESDEDGGECRKERKRQVYGVNKICADDDEEDKQIVRRSPIVRDMFIVNNLIESLSALRLTWK